MEISVTFSKLFNSPLDFSNDSTFRHSEALKCRRVQFVNCQTVYNVDISNMLDLAVNYSVFGWTNPLRLEPNE